MQYARGRRLSIAAAALAGGAADILDLALQSGYSSHEAFSRAFRARFGTTPEAVRERGTVDGLPMLQPLSIPQSRPRRTAAPRIVDAAALRVVGLAERYAVGETAGIPGQWQRFMGAGYAIPHRLPGIPISVLMDFDADGSFEYVCAVEVSAVTGLPPGLVARRIEAQRYAVFLHDGHVVDIGRTYADVWDWRLQELSLVGRNAPSLEKHLETFDPRTGRGGVAIWIPIEP
jgi:AraC family transcriptional regulator